MSSVEQLFKVVPPYNLLLAAYLGTDDIAQLANGPYCEDIEPRITAAFTDAGVPAIGEAHGIGSMVVHRFTCVPQETGNPDDDLVFDGTYRQLASPDVLATATPDELAYIFAGTRLELIRCVAANSLPGLVRAHVGLYLPETLIPGA